MIGGVVSGVISPPVGGFARNTGGGAPAGFVRLPDIDGSPLNDIDGQPLYEAR